MHHPLKPCDHAACTDELFRTCWCTLVQDYVRPGGPGQWVFIVAWILSLVRQWGCGVWGVPGLGTAPAGTRPVWGCAWLVLESRQPVQGVSRHGDMWPLPASPPPCRWP